MPSCIPFLRQRTVFAQINSKKVLRSFFKRPPLCPLFPTFFFKLVDKSTSLWYNTTVAI